MSPGSIVSLQEPITVFDDAGMIYYLDPGCHALVIGCDQYDITLLQHGEVLFTAASNSVSLVEAAINVS
jgi:hypothetical protein